jgi:hypothetical protein
MRASIILSSLLVLHLCIASIAQTAASSKTATTEAKPPAGVDPKLTSTDPEYGYSDKKPIKVGSVPDERVYLSMLLDEAGKPVTFRRLGSFGAGPDGHILDGYEVQTSTGRTVTLFIDMYHSKSDPKKQLAPKGFFKAK